ncbi:CDP-4-dehydro-6-deoxyglucose reductase [Acidovorax sp. 69]|uniref:CDP-6-deoxy-delta-3,4-glucoseen reductase n=1 Tax=Acidovorax sp. 69 TaxID=2035202 RepID=UPI000C24AC4B|nr:CDP-6-deoxy-delta-3,4-glucoseen reductase [Acidovorax sp. 69]PJI97308.1 CDP-4-dehydro-6-deoxyglucose reductase [Acidovorax sp. 69]
MKDFDLDLDLDRLNPPSAPVSGDPSAQEHRVTLLPAGKVFVARAGESLLDAAAHAGIRLPHQCKTGTCGACRALVLKGRVDGMAGASPTALTTEERAQGQRLLCCSAAAGDLELECAEIPHIPGIEVRKLPVRVVAMERLATDVMRVQLQPPAGQRLHYAAGQYVDVLLPGNRRRSYSLATPAREGTELLELHIRHLPGGQFTDQVFGKLKVRDVLRIEGPLGTFGMHTATDTPAILLASGTGFAPIQALVEQSARSGSQRQVHLYWGGRTRSDLYLHGLCGEWELAWPGRLRYVPVLSEASAADGWTGRTGWVHQAVLQDHPDLSQHEVYACGAPAMVDAARRDFVAHAGLPSTAFFADAFVAQRDPKV